MSTIDPKRDAVNAVLSEAYIMGIIGRPFWPTSSDRRGWKFFVDGEPVVLFYISKPYGGGLGPQDKVAVFVSITEGREGGLAEGCRFDGIFQSSIEHATAAVLLRRAIAVEYERSGGLAYAMSLLEPIDVGIDGCHFRTVGVSAQFNFAG